jgi:hypothetical protein
MERNRRICHSDRGKGIKIKESGLSITKKYSMPNLFARRSALIRVKP